MYSNFLRRGLSLLTVALAWAVLVSGSQAQPPKDALNSPAAIKKALDQKITLDFQTQDFNEAIEHLQQKTKIRFVLDNRFVFLQGGPFPGGPGTQINLKIDNGKVKTALQAMLSQFQLTYVILGNSVCITTAEIAVQQQMNQRVTVDVQDLPLAKVLKQLAEDTATNLVLDSRQADKAKNKVTLELEDVTLETAVRLLTEIAGLNSVRVGNVLFITSDERADKLRKEIPPPSTNPLDSLMGRYGIAGGFMPGMGGLAMPPRPPVVVPPPKEPAPPPSKELGKPKDQSEVKLIGPQNERDTAVARAPALFEKLKQTEPQMQELAKKLSIKEGGGLAQVGQVTSPNYKNPPLVCVEGSVMAVDKNLVKISVGLDMGVKKDSTLEVYRLDPEPKYLGRLLILDADFRSSMARLIVQPGVAAPTLLVGDRVATKLP